MPKRTPNSKYQVVQAATINHFDQPINKPGPDWAQLRRQPGSGKLIPGSAYSQRHLEKLGTLFGTPKGEEGITALKVFILDRNKHGTHARQLLRGTPLPPDSDMAFMTDDRQRVREGICLLQSSATASNTEVHVGTHGGSQPQQPQELEDGVYVQLEFMLLMLAQVPRKLLNIADKEKEHYKVFKAAVKAMTGRDVDERDPAGDSGAVSGKKRPSSSGHDNSSSTTSDQAGPSSKKPAQATGANTNSNSTPAGDVHAAVTAPTAGTEVLQQRITLQQRMMLQQHFMPQQQVTSFPVTQRQQQEQQGLQSVAGLQLLADVCHQEQQAQVTDKTT